jgi:hypothetical protein
MLRLLRTQQLLTLQLNYIRFDLTQLVDKLLLSPLGFANFVDSQVLFNIRSHLGDNVVDISADRVDLIPLAEDSLSDLELGVHSRLASTGSRGVIALL